MGLLDLFRPRWKHSDPSVRAEAIKDLSPDDLPRLSQVARHDSDPRVRRIALKKITDPDLLAEVAKSDPDEGLRRDAGEKANELWLEAALDEDDEVGAKAAVARLPAGRLLVDVVCKSSQPSVRQAAFTRISDDRLFAEIARRAGDNALRLRAVERIAAPELLRDLLLTDVGKELATRALERIPDGERQLLTDIAGRARSKAVRTAARDRLGPTVAGHAAPTPATADKAKAAAPKAPADPRELLCQRLEVLGKSSDPEDFADADDVLLQVRAEWAAVPGAPSQALRKRFDRAVARFQERRDALVRKGKAKGEAPKPVPVQAPPRREPAPEKPVEKPAEKPVAEKPPEKPPEPTPEEIEEQKRIALARARREEERRQREAEQAERLQKEAERREADEKRRVEEQAKNLQRVEEHTAKLEALAAAETLKPKQVEQALKQAHDAVVGANPLPRDRAPEVRKRYDAARAALVIKLHDLRERDDWQRWSNVPRLESLVQKVEQLAQALEGGLARTEVAAHLKALQADWKAVGPAPKDKSEALWQRFKEKGDQIFEKLRASTDEERGQNLTKKEALIGKVEALQASLTGENVDWKAVGEGLRALQADWKAAGPVPTKEQADALWTRFKTAADAVYAEQKKHYAELDEERQENLKKKELLCQKAEAVIYSNDWKGTTELLKGYQADWKATGPGPRSQKEAEDALWTRFRAACDKFFERRGAEFAKQDEERQGHLKQKEALCEQAEAVARKEDLDQDAAESEIKRLQSEWKRVGPVPHEQADALWARFRGAADTVFNRGRQYESVPVSSDGPKFANKLNLDGVLAKLRPQPEGASAQSSPPAAPADPAAHSATSPDPRAQHSWEHEAASEWEDIDRVISGQTPEPGSDETKG